jgi:hypothetical protein
MQEVKLYVYVVFDGLDDNKPLHMGWGSNWEAALRRKLRAAIVNQAEGEGLCPVEPGFTRHEHTVVEVKSVRTVN